MKTYTEKQVFAWLNKQPDSRWIYMANGYIYKNMPGCLLGEFLKDKEGAHNAVVTPSGYFRQLDGDKLVQKVKLTKPSIFDYFRKYAPLNTVKQLKDALV